MGQKSFREYINVLEGLFASDEKNYIQLTNVEIHRDAGKALLISCEELGDSKFIPMSQLRVDSFLNLWVSNYIYQKERV